MKPFENPCETIQPNLAIRDGELGRELERMRILMERVREKIEGMPQVQRGPLEMAEEVRVEDKLAAIFAADARTPKASGPE